MTYLPTFPDCLDIVANNNAFYHNCEMVDGYRLHNFGYRLPGLKDFVEPIAGDTLQAWELRGITFVESPDGTFDRYLMLNKFFCLNQTKGTMYADVKDKVIAQVTDKRDGSLIRFIKLPNGRLVAKSKGSFTGPHCEMALALLEKNPALKWFIEYSFSLGNAVILEMTGPDNEVVLKYDTPELRIVQIRDELTGEYFDTKNFMNNKIMDINKYFVDHDNITSLDELIALQKTTKNREGWVVLFTDGTIIKVKTDWYEDMHRHFVEKNHSDKAFIEMTINETIDDAIGFMIDGDIKNRMIEISDKVGHHFNDIIAEVLTIVHTFTGDVSNKDDKSAFAKLHNGKPNFSLYMFGINNPDDKKIEAHVKRSILASCKNEKDATNFLKRF